MSVTGVRWDEMGGDGASTNRMDLPQLSFVLVLYCPAPSPPPARGLYPALLRSYQGLGLLRAHLGDQAQVSEAVPHLVCESHLRGFGLSQGSEQFVHCGVTAARGHP